MALQAHPHRSSRRRHVNGRGSVATPHVVHTESPTCPQVVAEKALGPGINSSNMIESSRRRVQVRRCGRSASAPCGMARVPKAVEPGLKFDRVVPFSLGSVYPLLWRGHLLSPGRSRQQRKENAFERCPASAFCVHGCRPRLSPDSSGVQRRL